MARIILALAFAGAVGCVEATRPERSPGLKVLASGPTSGPRSSAAAADQPASLDIRFSHRGRRIQWLAGASYEIRAIYTEAIVRSPSAPTDYHVGLKANPNGSTGYSLNLPLPGSPAGRGVPRLRWAQPSVPDDPFFPSLSDPFKAIDPGADAGSYLLGQGILETVRTASLPSPIQDPFSEGVAAIPVGSANDLQGLKLPFASAETLFNTVFASGVSYDDASGNYSVAPATQDRSLTDGTTVMATRYYKWRIPMAATALHLGTSLPLGRLVVDVRVLDAGATVVSHGSAAALLQSGPNSMTATLSWDDQSLVTGLDVALPKPPDTRPQFFGLHIHRADTGQPWPSVPFGIWRLTDAYVYWSYIETAPGVFNWSRLDNYMNMAEQHGVDVIMPISMTPRFYSARPDSKSPYGLGQGAEPADMTNWTNWVHALATRYKGRIRYYEVWNEPQLADWETIIWTNWQFFNGSTATLVKLGRLAAAEIKRVDPDAKLITPSFVGSSAKDIARFEHFLDAGGGVAEDIIGYHLYVATPEMLPTLAAQLRSALAARGLAKPLWNTEMGLGIPSVERPETPFPGMGPTLPAPDVAAVYVARALIHNWFAGIGSVSWYGWDNYVMGLAEPSGARKPAANAYARVHEWLSPASTGSCETLAGEIWSCRLERAGHPAWIVWAASGSATIASPVTGGGAVATDLVGGTTSVPAGGQVLVGTSPILIEPQ